MNKTQGRGTKALLRREDRNTPGRFTLSKPEVSAGLMVHKALNADLITSNSPQTEQFPGDWENSVTFLWRSKIVRKISVLLR